MIIVVVMMQTMNALSLVKSAKPQTLLLCWHWLKHGAKGWHPIRETKDEVAISERDWYGFGVLKFGIQLKGGGNARKDDVFLYTDDMLEIAT